MRTFRNNDVRFQEPVGRYWCLNLKGDRLNLYRPRGTTFCRIDGIARAQNRTLGLIRGYNWRYGLRSKAANGASDENPSWRGSERPEQQTSPYNSLSGGACRNAPSVRDGRVAKGSVSAGPGARGAPADAPVADRCRWQDGVRRCLRQAEYGPSVSYDSELEHPLGSSGRVFSDRRLALGNGFSALSVHDFRSNEVPR